LIYLETVVDNFHLGLLSGVTDCLTDPKQPETAARLFLCCTVLCVCVCVCVCANVCLVEGEETQGTKAPAAREYKTSRTNDGRKSLMYFCYKNRKLWEKNAAALVQMPQ